MTKEFIVVSDALYGWGSSPVREFDTEVAASAWLEEIDGCYDPYEVLSIAKNPNYKGR